MDFIDRQEEMERLDHVLGKPGAFAAVWGRRRVGKSRLLLEWARRHDGLYTVAEPSAPAVQRRYLAAAVAERFPGFADVEYPDWGAFLRRLADESARRDWPGPLIIDELPYLIDADPNLPGALQNWIDRPAPRPCLVASGSSLSMMHGAILDSSAPLYGRALEAFAVRPLRPGHLAEAFGPASPRQLASLYALWGGMPRYWELAEPFGTDLAASVDALVLNPSGPLHNEPDRLLRSELPPATALRPLLDIIGAGACRLSEVGARLGRPASSLSGPLATLTGMGLVRRELPYGSHPRSGKRSLYRLSDPFLRLWFGIVAPQRALLAEAPPETRIACWRRMQAQLEAAAWEDLCRMAVPRLHQCDVPLARLGPWQHAQRYWRGNEPERDIVARSVDGRRLLVGEAKWSAADAPAVSEAGLDALPDAATCEIVRARFVPEAPAFAVEDSGEFVVDAHAVLAALR